MEKHGMPAGEQDDSIQLRPYLEAVWRRRMLIGLALAAVTAVFLVFAILAVVRAPSERVASVQFRLLFSGAAEGEYPNGTPFSPMEIIGPFVLNEVFRSNDLQQYGSRSDFAEGLSVQQSGTDLDLLSSEYQARLADTQLTAVDRAAIEADYRTKRESLRDPSYTLTYRRTERFQRMPAEVSAKVLTDILATWAHQAQVRKGVLKYDVGILTDGVLSREAIQGLDYLIAADRLRAHASRVVRAIDELAEVPGAMAVRVENVSLQEARARLEDVLRFEIEPLMGTIREAGLTKDPRALTLYASNMVFQLQLEKREAEARGKALESALASYVSQRMPQSVAAPSGAAPSDQPVMPQLSESFLDRLQRMAVQAQEGEMEYRRKLTDQALAENQHAAALDKELSYYNGLEASLRGMASAGGQAMAETVSGLILKAFDTVERATKDVATIYTEISAQNLNPSARMYAITLPYSERTFRGLSINRLGLTYAAVLLFTLLAGILVALAAYVVGHKKTIAT